MVKWMLPGLEEAESGTAIRQEVDARGSWDQALKIVTGIEESRRENERKSETKEYSKMYSKEYTDRECGVVLETKLHMLEKHERIRERYIAT